MKSHDSFFSGFLKVSKVKIFAQGNQNSWAPSIIPLLSSDAAYARNLLTVQDKIQTLSSSVKMGIGMINSNGPVLEEEKIA